jgi:hypothetical protein
MQKAQGGRFNTIAAQNTLAAGTIRIPIRNPRK